MIAEKLSGEKSILWRASYDLSDAWCFKVNLSDSQAVFCLFKRICLIYIVELSGSKILQIIHIPLILKHLANPETINFGRKRNLWEGYGGEGLWKNKNAGASVEEIVHVLKFIILSVVKLDGAYEFDEFKFFNPNK